MWVLSKTYRARGPRIIFTKQFQAFSLNRSFAAPDFCRDLQLLASRSGLLIFVFRTSCPQGLIKGGVWLLHGKTKTEIIQRHRTRQGRCA